MFGGWVAAACDELNLAEAFGRTTTHRRMPPSSHLSLMVRLVLLWSGSELQKHLK